MRQQDTLGRTGRAGRVHDDGGVFSCRRGSSCKAMQIFVSKLHTHTDTSNPASPPTLGSALRCKTLTDRARVANLDHLAERDDFHALLEAGRIGRVQLVLHEDDFLHIRRHVQYALKLGQQLVGRDHGRYLRLVDTVRHTVIPERGVDRHHRHVLLEATVRRNHPFGPRFGKDDDVLLRLLAQLAQTATEAGGRVLRLDEVAPHVVAHAELLEHPSVRLHLVLLAQDLARTDAPLGGVHLRDEVEHTLERVDVVLHHLYVHLTGRIDRPVRDRAAVLLDDLGL